MKNALGLLALLAVIGCGGSGAVDDPAAVVDGEPSGPVWGGPVATARLPIIYNANVARVIVTGTDETGVYFKYITEFNPSNAAPYAIPLPLTTAGQSYSIEVITADNVYAADLATITGRSIKEYWKATGITLGTDGDAVTVNLAQITALPALVASDIFVGLGAPYHQYVLTASSISLPFSTRWTSTCENCGEGFTAPVRQLAGTATFTTPPLATAPAIFNVSARFVLDRGYMQSTTEAPWVFTVRLAETPVVTRDVVINPSDDAAGPTPPAAP